MSENKLESCNCSSNRRGFLKTAGLAGLALSGLPQVASAISLDPNQEKEILKSKAVQDGKAKHITLLHTADIHAQLYTHDEFFWENEKAIYKQRGGFAVLKTMLNTLKAQNPEHTLVIDGGDCFQGGAVAALSEGKAIVPLINNIGYDLVLPGNWEVVYGKEMMRKDMGGYHAQKICANMFHQTKDIENGDLMFPPYWTNYMAGIKVGFIGYNDPLTPKRQSPAYSEGINFTKPELNVAKYVRILRDYEKCEMVFLVTHMGLAQQVDLGNHIAVDGVDYILGADTHERVRKPIETKYTKVTEPGAFGSFISKLDIVIENGKIKEHSYQLLDVDPEKYQPDPEMLDLVQKARAPYQNRLDVVIGKSKVPLVRYYVLENPMDNMITDAIMWKFKPDIALSNGFRFCPPLVPDSKTGMADITYEFLWSMLPVESVAKTGEITGKQLWDWLEKELHNVFADNPAERFGGWVIRFCGMEINFTAGKPKGSRLNWVKVKSKKVKEDKVYSVVACEREGDPDDTLCRIDHVNFPQKLGYTLHQIMIEYLAVHSPVSPKIEGRVTATDQPQNVLSQLEGYDYKFI
ncbi:bifunctional metallophosphatase/5'-nucleotidase [Pedobacter cryophilus]|uniref:Bifunctional metallophosphatase/5'-nucleotidase n=1 Tax=Pedobacter cryophilus TaxID=2571271 RepID=A0A4U1C1A0_9SPHI|nr:bifunctional metallophosphatase/5'-nucleotidase [Pedobacter cryophilus]TKB97663.1 bifunctional metallophosphatase/5'-nucleotidase [Pedobacter cryophilus]